jgi:hypothetical protein
MSLAMPFLAAPILLRQSASSAISVDSRPARTAKNQATAATARRRTRIAATSSPMSISAAQIAATCSTKGLTTKVSTISCKQYAIQWEIEADDSYSCECGFLLCLHCGEAMRYCPCGIENDSFSEYPPEKDEHGQMKEVPDEEQLARQDKEIEGLKMTRRYCQIPEELKQSYLAFARRRMLAVLDRDR